MSSTGSRTSGRSPMTPLSPGSTESGVSANGHGDKRDRTSLSIQDRDQGGLLVTCFVGCDRQTIIAALERDTGLTIWQAWTPTGATQGRFSRLTGVGGGAPEPRKQRQRRPPDGGHGPDPDGPGGLAERRYCQGQRNRPSGLALAQRAESLEAGVSPAVVPPLAAGLGALAGQGAAHRRRFHRRPGGAPLPPGCSLNRSWPCPSRTGAAASPQT